MNRLVWLIAGAVIATASASAQQPPPPAPAAQASPAPVTRTFGSDTGLVLNFIKPDKAASFEAVIAKVKEALETSPNPVRQQQAASWRVFKAQESGAGGAALYVYIVDPTVKDADYSISKILSEAFSGDEWRALIQQYNDAYATGQNIVNLKLLADPAK